jgi:hypothetical protein
MSCVESYGFRRVSRGFGKRGIGFERLMEDLDVPPFFVGCRDFVPVCAQLATHKIQNASAAVFVRN